MTCASAEANCGRRLLDQLRERIRYLHYSRSTEDIYVYWCKAFIRFHGLRHPREMGGTEVEAFLTWLADERQVASATHKQALSALLFLYTKVLELSLPWINQIERPRVRRRLPVVLSREEVSAVLSGMTGELGLLAQLLYGAGMRINEALQLRVKDVDFAHQAVIVRAGKGGKDLVLKLPQALAQPLREQIASSRKVWAEDVAAGTAGVEMPHALERKYPRAGALKRTLVNFRFGHIADPRMPTASGGQQPVSGADFAAGLSQKTNSAQRTFCSESSPLGELGQAAPGGASAGAPRGDPRHWPRTALHAAFTPA